MDKNNAVQLRGNLGKDPEVHTTSHGSVTTFSIATKAPWNGADGKPRTDWHKIAIYHKANADKAAEFKKGDFVQIEGRLESRTYQGADDKPHTDVHIAVRQYDKVELLAKVGSGPRDNPRQAAKPLAQPSS